MHPCQRIQPARTQLRALLRPDRVRDEAGISTLFVVLFAVALLAVAGLVIDGGYTLGAKREAMNQAQQAARVGADALDRGALRSGETRVNTGQAMVATEAYLARIGASGTVTVDGGKVTVVVTTTRPTSILSAVGVDSLPVKATATAESIDEDTPG